ncbi:MULTISPECIES: hypothetical protein [unclassified Yoonia]|uniref:hypothetical protein n=1 Tax=unclassified Yoonia TaxID=2629118 RepID=UPI002B0000EB|nr:MULTISPECIES: hypothetical protein [unclassified Yoonia]
MNPDPDTDPTALAKARDRVDEISLLFGRIRALLDHSLRVTDDLSEETPRAVITRMDQLIAAHLKMLTAEEAFNAAHNKNPTDLAELDRIRCALERRFRRLCASSDPQGVSEQP